MSYIAPQVYGNAPAYLDPYAQPIQAAPYIATTPVNYDPNYLVQPVPVAQPQPQVETYYDPKAYEPHYRAPKPLKTRQQVVEPPKPQHIPIAPTYYEQPVYAQPAVSYVQPAVQYAQPSYVAPAQYVGPQYYA